MAKKISNRKYPGDKAFFVFIGKRQLSEDIYEFIFGSKRYDIPVLFRGFDKIIETTKNEKLRYDYRVIRSVVEDAYNKELLRQEERFKNKFGKSSGIFEQKAKKGDDQSLFQLIAFNKLVLFADFVQERILRAEAEEDFKFLEGLGNAVRKLSGCLEDYSGRDDGKQRNLRRLFRIFSIFGYNFNKVDAAKELIEIIQAVNESDPNEGFPYPAHSGVINKTLKRMMLRK